MTSTSSDPPTSFPPRTPTTAPTSKAAADADDPRQTAFPGRRMPCRSPQRNTMPFATTERHAARRGRTPQAASAGKQPLDHFPQSVLSSAETLRASFPAVIVSTSFAFTAGSAVTTIVAAVPSGPTALRL